MGNRSRKVPCGDGWAWGDFHTEILMNADATDAQALFESCLDFSLLTTDLPPAADEGIKLFSDLPPGFSLRRKTVFGLFEKEKLVGVIDSIDGYPEDGLWFIGLFLLHPDCRGKGVGRKWLTAYLEDAAANGVKAVRLGVVEQNKAGYAFWQSNGFTFEARRPPVKYGNRDNIILVMRKELPETVARNTCPF